MSGLQLSGQIIQSGVLYRMIGDIVHIHHIPDIGGGGSSPRMVPAIGGRNVAGLILIKIKSELIDKTHFGNNGAVVRLHLEFP